MSEADDESSTATSDNRITMLPNEPETVTSNGHITKVADESAPPATSSSRVTMVSGPVVRVGPQTLLLEDKIALLSRYRLIERPPRPAGKRILLVLICMLGGFALRHFVASVT
jgi:hypothetical protein